MESMQDHPMQRTPEEFLKQAALALLMQAYGVKRYAAHPPTRMQWYEVGAALTACGVRLPSDWVEMLIGLPATFGPDARP
jgi:hypothetical protein